MFVKVIYLEILVIIVLINYAQTAQPQKNNIPKNKPKAKLNQGNNIAKNIPQTKQQQNKPQTKLNQRTNIKKDVHKSKLKQGNSLQKNKPQISQRNGVPKNKPQPNLKQKVSKPIKAPQANLRIKTQKNIQAKQKNNVPKSKPQPNESNNISKNKLQTNKWNNIPRNIPNINAASSFLKNIRSSKLNQGNDMGKHMLQTNPWNNKEPKNIPQPTNQDIKVPKKILQTNQDIVVPKNISPLKLNQENHMLNNVSEINQWNNITKNTTQFNKAGVKQKKWKFQDYLKKFEPKTIWEQIDKQRKYNGRQISDEEQMEIMLLGIDPTDEIMKLRIEDGVPKMIVQPDGRRGWRPMTGIHWFEKDKFQLRRRLYELMKQAIYQARNKMIIMQIYREKYKTSALYKMGFLMNKADNGAKTFGKFSFRAFRNCLVKRETDRPPLFDLLSTNERQLNLWFNVEILVDLIKKNDLICKEIFQETKSSRQKMFDAQFIN